ncbi:MAG: hypothetical protein ACREXU_19035, partial [Gammaproteobacteria bacterium]
GEFRAPGWLDRCGGDSVFVWDPSQGNRISVIDPFGAVVRQYRAPGMPSLMSCSGQGMFAVVMLPSRLTRPDPTGRSPPYTGALWLVNARGDTVRSLGEIAIGENRPLGRLARIAMANDRLYVGTAESAFVDVYRLDGRRLGSLGISVEARSASRGNYERAIDRMLVGWSPNDRDRVRNYLLSIPMPARLPPYSDLFANPEGELWAVISAPGDSVTRLRAIAPDGRILGDVQLPPETEVFEVGRDYILGAYSTEEGQQRVAMYRLRRGR